MYLPIFAVLLVCQNICLVSVTCQRPNCEIGFNAAKNNNGYEYNTTDTGNTTQDFISEHSLQGQKTNK